ncbi:MAG: hypothetical protein AAFX94_15600, partial [Myxococcota bacterium]
KALRGAPNGAAPPAKGSVTGPNVFSATTKALTEVPSDADAQVIQVAMQMVVDQLVKDGVWLQPLTPDQELPGFPRPLLEDSSDTLGPKEVEAWVQRGHLDAFKKSIRQFANAISKRYPPGHPQRAVALGSGFRAFTNKFYAHAGKVYYQHMGTDRDGRDWADLVTAPYRVKSGNPEDRRTAIDCHGYTMLAEEFFAAAGLKTKTFLSSSRSAFNDHQQGVAVGSGVQIGFSNGDVFLLPSPESGEMGATFQEFVRQQLRDPTRFFETDKVDEFALETGSGR